MIKPIKQYCLWWYSHCRVICFAVCSLIRLQVDIRSLQGSLDKDPTGNSHKSIIALSCCFSYLYKQGSHLVLPQLDLSYIVFVRRFFVSLPLHLSLPSNLLGQYSQCYFVHRHLNNHWHNKANSVIAKSYLAIIASNGSHTKIRNVHLNNNDVC